MVCGVNVVLVSGINAVNPCTIFPSGGARTVLCRGGFFFSSPPLFFSGGVLRPVFGAFCVDFPVLPTNDFGKEYRLQMEIAKLRIGKGSAAVEKVKGGAV